MKIKIFAITCCFVLFTVVAFGAEEIKIETDKQYPSAFLPAPSYTFETVLEGAVITHDFIIQNKGTSSLNIEKVKSG